MGKNPYGNERKVHAMGQRTSPLLTFVIDQELLERLDDFRFEQRFQSRAQAIRWLLEWALDNGATPEEKD
jgi:hypothetical protein